MRPTPGFQFLWALTTAVFLGACASEGAAPAPAPPGSSGGGQGGAGSSGAGGGQNALDAGGTADVSTVDEGTPSPGDAGVTKTRDAAAMLDVADAANDAAAPPGDGGVLEDYTRFVNPWIETNKGRWFFSTPAAMPFGMVKLTPHSKNQDQGGGGYNYSVPTALGFCHVHGWMSTGLCVMPTTGGNFNVMNGENGWKSDYSHSTET